MVKPTTINAAVAGGLALTLILTGATTNPFSKHQKAFYADANVVAFVRPGLVITITSAEIATDGTISVVFYAHRSDGAPWIVRGCHARRCSGSISSQLTSRKASNSMSTTLPAAQTGAVSGTVTQAAAESNGVFTRCRRRIPLHIRYQGSIRFRPDDDSHNRHIRIRNLSEFDLGTNYASTTFNFVPNGSAVTTVRDVIRTQSCNKCHDQLSSHGGSRRGVEMCNFCHTPQKPDPDTGNTVDFKVMVHKIHMGADLPSVQAGKPYQIIGNQGSRVMITLPSYIHQTRADANPATSRTPEQRKQRGI